MISILTPTTVARKVFWPWACAQVQSAGYGVYDHIEWLVAVDDRAAFSTFFDSNVAFAGVNLRILECRGMTLGQKRQELLEAAAGETIAWLDDDDWHHPLWLTDAQTILHGLPTGFGMAYCGAFYVDLETNRGVDIITHRNMPMPISFVGPKTLALESQFPDWKTGEDVQWFSRLPRERMFYAYQDRNGRDWQWAAFVHPLSTTNGAKRGWRFDLGEEVVNRMLGLEWMATALVRAALAEQVRAQVARV